MMAGARLAARVRRGRVLFASKGGVVCHSINGVGGDFGPSLDASERTRFADTFEFAGRIWTGAAAMISL